MRRHSTTWWDRRAKFRSSLIKGSWVNGSWIKIISKFYQPFSQNRHYPRFFGDWNIFGFRGLSTQKVNPIAEGRSLTLTHHKARSSITRLFNEHAFILAIPQTLGQGQHMITPLDLALFRTMPSSSNARAKCPVSTMVPLNYKLFHPLSINDFPLVVERQTHSNQLELVLHTRVFIT